MLPTHEQKKKKLKLKTNEPRCSNNYSLEELEKAAKEITYDKLMEHYEKILKHTFIEAMIYGNVDKSETENYIQLFAKYLNRGEILGKEIIENNRERMLQWPENNKHLRFQFINPNDNDPNSAIGAAYLCGKDTLVLYLCVFMSFVCFVIK